MTSPREIIADFCYKPINSDAFPDALIEALTAAGYRILGPDELDPVTLERAAEVAGKMLRFADTTSEADIAITDAIRSLKGGRS